MWRDYLSFYRVALDEAVTAVTWRRILDPDHPFECRLAEFGDGPPLGFVIFHNHGSTWSKGADCYLEDLFVSSDARGQGVGRALIETVESAARVCGCDRLYWHTNADNVTARILYDSIAGGEDGHVRYRIAL